MSKLDELKEVFPSAKEIEIAGRKFLVVPMVWRDFLEAIQTFGEIMSVTDMIELLQTIMGEKKDVTKLLTSMNKLLGIFAKWIGSEEGWLESHLTAKNCLKLLTEFLEVNEWEEVKPLFLALKLKVQPEQAKDRAETKE